MVILRVPSSCSRSDAVLVEPAVDGFGWYAVTPDRQHGWLCADFGDALHCARGIANELGVCIISSAERIAP